MVVELLNEYDLVKEFGEGVDRVYRDMAAAGLPEPEYRQSEFMLYATLKNKNWGKEDASWADTAHDQALSGPGPEKGPKKGPKRGPEAEMDELNIRCNAVLEEMKANPKIPTVVQAGSIASWKRIRLFILSFDGIFQSAALTDIFYHGRINLRSQSATTSYLTTKEQ